MPTLYVTEQGARLEKEYRRLLVVKNDVVLMALPFARVDHVVLVGRIGVTTPLLHALLAEDVGLTLLNRLGRLQGRLMPAAAKNIPLRQRQYARAQEPDFCLALARAIVDGKLRNSRAQALRLARTRPELDATPIARIDSALGALRDAPDLNTVRGLEGSGARAYFGVLRQALRFPIPFEKRTRRPPKDPINALLSFGYSLLTQNFMAACEIAGLDPYDGFLHADKYGRPALALDLMEEFRSVIVDSVILNLINRKRIGPNDFVSANNGGVYLHRRKLRVFFGAYTARINTQVIYPPAGRTLSYQKIFEAQTRQLRRVIEGRAECYRPFRTR